MVLLLLLIATPMPSAGQPESTWVVGDVFAGVGNGQYKVYSNDGTFKETIDNGLGGNLTETTGCAFNLTRDKLYTTDFDLTKVVVFADAHPHTVLQVIDPALTGNYKPESIVFARNGDFYVGFGGWPGNPDIVRYNAAGVFQQAYNVELDRRGTDWLELASDQHTMFYTSEGRRVLRYDVAGAGQQLPDFATLPNTYGDYAFALRLLPPGDGSGGLLVAQTSDIKRLDGSGNVVQTYDAPGEDFWFALNLDPNGTSFWSGGYNSYNLYRFNIATGAVEVGPIAVDPPYGLSGICVKGEVVAGLPTPSPTPLSTPTPTPTNTPTVTRTATRTNTPVPSTPTNTPSQPTATPGGSTPSPTRTPAPTATPPSGCLLQDASFEAGSPNPVWQEGSTNFGTPLCTEALCGAPGPHTGEWWAWFGGVQSGIETGYLRQTVTIPSGSATLSYWLKIPTANGTGGDFLRVMIDGTVVAEYTVASQPYFANYTAVTHNASQFANGAPHQVHFESTTYGGAITNFYVDDVNLCVSAPAPTNTPSAPSPTPTRTPTAPAGYYWQLYLPIILRNPG